MSEESLRSRKPHSSKKGRGRDSGRTADIVEDDSQIPDVQGETLDEDSTVSQIVSPPPKLVKSIILDMTESEFEVYQQILKLEGTKNGRNVLRRGLLKLAQQHGLELAPEIFVDRESGNRQGRPRPGTRKR